MNSFLLRVLEIKLPKDTKKNGTLNLHFIVHDTKVKHQDENMFTKRTFVYKSVDISKYKIKNSKKFINLLENFNNNLNNETTEKKLDKLPTTHLLTHLSFSIMYNSIKFNINQVPGEIFNEIILTDKHEYLPITYVNKLAIRDEHYAVSVINLRLNQIQ